MSEVRAIVISSLLAVVLACGGKSAPPPSHPATAAAAPPIAVAPARSVLQQYLVATQNGAHGRAWELLTHRDQAATPRATYVSSQQADDRLRAQVRTQYSIAAVREAGARADATVTVTTGLGAEQLHFVLRRDPDHWRIDYRASWR